MLHKIFLIFFFVLTFIGCEQRGKDNIDNADDLFRKKEEIDVAIYKDYKMYAEEYMALNSFFSYYFEHHDKFFSLDDDLSVFVGDHGGKEYFLYSKNREENRIWSSICGTYEKISKDQLKILDSLENDIKKDFLHHPKKGEQWHSLFLWKGKSQKGRLRRIEYFTHGYELYKSESDLYNYLTKKIFVHRCKKR